MSANRWKYFRWTPRTAWITFVYVAVVPSIVGYIGWRSEVSGFVNHKVALPNHAEAIATISVGSYPGQEADAVLISRANTSFEAKGEVTQLSNSDAEVLGI